MTHYLGLEYAGSTIDLSTGNNILGDYGIKSARQGPNGMYEQVSERIALTVRGASPSAAQDTWESIGRWISATSERRATGEGEKLYLEFQPSGDSTRWRSEIILATLEPSPDMLRLWSNNEVSGALEIVRESFFWGSRTPVSISNGNGTGTSGVSIDNRSDGSNYAYIDIAGSNIDGELPTPAEIWLQNNDGSGRGYSAFYIGVNARSDPASFVPVLEGEDGSGMTSTGSISTYSNGGYGTISISGGNNQTTLKWTIPAAWADAFAGRYARVLVKVTSAVSNWSVKAKIMEQYGLITLYETQPRITSSVGILDVGSVPVPPTAYTEDLAEQVLALDVYHDGTVTSGSLSIDYIMLMPTDAQRTIVQRGMQIPASDKIIFDEIEKVWVSNESSLKHPIYSPRGPGVLLWPGVTQRLFLVHDRGTGADAADAKTIWVYHRPRRLTV